MRPINEKNYLGTLQGSNTAVTSPNVDITVPNNQMFKGQINITAYGNGAQPPNALLQDTTGAPYTICYLTYNGFLPGASTLVGFSQYIELPPGTYNIAGNLGFSGAIASTISYHGGLYRL